MKVTKLMKLGLLLFLMILPLGMLIAQVVDPPEDVVDLVSNFSTFIGSLAGYAAVSIFVTGMVNGWLKTTKTWVKRLISWVVPTVLVVVVTLVFKAGFLAEESIWIVLATGLGAGLVSNGIFDIGFVNVAISWISEKVGGATEKKE